MLNRGEVLLCQICNKNNATIHFTKIINGNIEERHICDLCAKENNEFDFDLPFSFHKILTSLICSIQEDSQPTKDVICPRCKLTYKKFLEIGKFGCSDCYDTFKKDVDSLLKGIHGNIEHKGKIPMGNKTKITHMSAIESLRTELDKSIKIEDFEKAAILRDEIKRIKIELENIEGDLSD